jgi:phenylacetate-coenzyme A ligase PaaK-like adenylate-forming protein
VPSTAMRWYSAAPVWAQELAVNAYGALLWRRRHGAEHYRTLAELRRSERWPLAMHQEHQLDQLRRLIRHAAATVPFYRDRCDPARVRHLQDLERLPILTKEEAREAGDALVSGLLPPHGRLTIQTSGTTGSPLQVRCDRAALQRNYAFFSRALDWAGCGVRPRVATFAGRTIVPATQEHPPFWRRNLAGNALLCSSYHLAPDTLPAYVEALRAFGPELIDSYPSSLAPLARHLLANGIADLRPRAIVTSSETLTVTAREEIEQAFGCGVYDQYGAAEMAAFATQCADGRYHCHPEYGIVEVRCDGRAARPGEIGELVVTGFVNPAMPFLRYATGDLAELGEGPCPCGRESVILRRILGRQDDVLVTPEGRLVGRLDPVFKGVPAMVESRITQDLPDHVLVETVVKGHFAPADRHRLREELARRLGPRMRIDLVQVPRLERSAGGKLRAVVNLVGRGNGTTGVEIHAGRPHAGPSDRSGLPDGEVVDPLGLGGR